MATRSKPLKLWDAEKFKNVNSVSLKYWDRYETDMGIRDLSPSTVYNYESDFKQWMIYVLDNQGNAPVTELEEEDIEEFLFYCKKHGNNSARMKRRMSTISALYRYLRKKKIIKENPMEFIDRPTKDVAVVKQTYLTPDEVKLMREKLNMLVESATTVHMKDNAMTLRLYALFSLSTMARVNAVRNTLWKSIDYENRMVHDVLEKEGKIVDLMFSKEVSELLKELKEYRTDHDIEDGGYVFVGTKINGACGATTETLSQKLSRLFKEHFQTAVAMYGVAMVKQGLREVYNNVVDIDTSMTNLKKVTNETESAYSSFLSSASSQARELGASISDVIDSTAEWSRLGYTLDESQELAKWSTVLSNIGDGIDSASDAASYLVSILKGFRMEADEVEHVVNVLNSVGNNEPISESGIAEALVRSASALSAAGNSFEESVSLISAANSVLQDPDTVGTTLKTISMYLRASKTDAEAFGVSVDDMAGSVSELRSELKSLTGVDIMKDAAGTEFKSTYQILKEISAVWDKLTDVSKANVTEMLGGKRNSNAVLSVIEQFSIAEKSMEDAANSSNSAMTEQERMMDSIEGRLKRLNASFEKFSNDVLSSDLVKFFVTLATKIVDAADGMVNLAGSIPAITAAISGVLSVMQMSGKLKNGAGKVNMPSYICCV